MELLRVSLLFSLLSTLLQLIKGQSCTSQVNLDSINSNELQCQARQDCTGLDCFNQNSFLRNFANLFEIRPLPCATPSPALWLQVLGEVDPTNNNRRNVYFNVTWNSNTTENLNVMNDGLSFGIYHLSVDFSRSEAGSSVGLAVQLTRSGTTTWVVNNTVIPLNTASCSVQTTTTVPPLMPGTTTTRSPSASDNPRTTNDSTTDTPTSMNTSMNTYTSPLGTASGSHPIPQVVLNFILVLLTMLVMTTLAV